VEDLHDSLFVFEAFFVFSLVGQKIRPETAGNVQTGNRVREVVRREVVPKALVLNNHRKQTIEA
jgi:hypothetical protein